LDAHTAMEAEVPTTGEMRGKCGTWKWKAIKHAWQWDDGDGWTWPAQWARAPKWDSFVRGIICKRFQNQVDLSKCMVLN